MFCRIKSNILVTLPEECTTDLTKVSGLEFYVSQVGFFRQYKPTVLSAHKMLVSIPLDDAMKLCPGSPMYLQFAFTDADGNHVPSDKKKLCVKDFLKKEGYHGAEV